MKKMAFPKSLYRRSQRATKPKHRRLLNESLEARQLMASDLQLTHQAPAFEAAWEYQSGHSGDRNFRTVAFDPTGNLAAGATAVADNPLPHPAHAADFLTDGKYGNGSAFVSTDAGATITVDLGSAQTFDRIHLGQDRLGDFDERSVGHFHVEVSTDGSTFLPIYQSIQHALPGMEIDEVSNTQTLAATFDPVSARFVRLVAMGGSFRLDEIEIYHGDPNYSAGDGIELVAVDTPTTFQQPDQYPAGLAGNPDFTRQPFISPENLAIGASVTASDPLNHFAHRAELLTDGIYGNGSAFVAASEGSTVTIDLGGPRTFDRLHLGQERLGVFEERPIDLFGIEVSSDGELFTPVFDFGDLATDQRPDHPVRGTQTLAAVFNPVTARFVRLTSMGQSFRVDELEVYNGEPTYVQTLDRSRSSGTLSWVDGSGSSHQLPDIPAGKPFVFHPPAAGSSLGTIYAVNGPPSLFNLPIWVDGGVVGEMVVYPGAVPLQFTSEAGNAATVSGTTNFALQTYQTTAVTIHQGEDHDFGNTADLIAEVDRWVKQLDSDPSNEALQQSTLDATLRYAASDYQDRLTRLARIHFGTAEPLRGQVVEVSGRLNPMRHVTGGDFRTLGYQMRASVSFTQPGFATPLIVPDDLVNPAGAAHQFAMSVADAESSVLSQLAPGQFLYGSSVMAEKNAVGESLVRLRAVGGAYVDEVSGQTFGSVGGYLFLSAKAEVEINRLLNLGYTVTTTRTLGNGNFTKADWIATRMTAENEVQTVRGNYSTLVISNTTVEYLFDYSHTESRVLQNAFVNADVPGDLRTQELDVAVPATGLAVEVQRSYHSEDQSASLFGPGWRFAEGAWIQFNSFQAVWHDGTGRDLAFSGSHPLGNSHAPGVSQYFAPQTDKNLSLSTQVVTRDAETFRIWTLTDSDGTINEFRMLPDGNDHAHLIARVDRNGNRQELRYDADGKLRQLVDVTDPQAEVVKLIYTVDQQRLQSVETPDGRRWTYTYTGDATRRLESIFAVSGDGQQVQWVRHEYLVLGNGEVGLIRTMTDAQTTAEYQYSPAGRLRSVTTADGTTATQRYHDLGRVRYHTDPDGNTSTVRFDGLGYPVEQVDASGATVRTSYHPDSKLPVRTIYSDGTDVQFNYDDRQNLVVRRQGNVEDRFTYDPVYSQLVSQERVVGNLPADRSVVLTQHLDGSGNIIARVDATGQTTWRTYDSRGRVTSESTGRSQIQYQYNAAGQVTTRTAIALAQPVNSAAGLTTTQVVAAAPTLVAAPSDAAVETFEYDAQDRLTVQVAAGGLRTELTYDSRNRVIVRRVVDANGEESVTGTTFDLEGRRSRTTYPTGAVATVLHDRSGRIIAQSNAPGGGDDEAVLTVYSPAGQRQRVVDGSGAATSYEYDLVGRLISTTDPTGVTTRQTYNAAGQVATQTDGAGGETRFGYDSHGRLVSRTDPSGGVSTWSYDSMGRLTSATNPIGGITHYRHDAAGRMTQRSTSTLAEFFDYDASANLHRITAVDLAGLGLTQPIATPGDVSADRHRITQIQYDAFGRAIRWTDPLGQVSSATYDALGNRQSMTNAAGVITTFTIDPLVGETVAVTDFGDPNIAKVATRRKTDSSVGQRTLERVESWDANDVPVFGDPLSTHAFDALGRINEIVDLTGRQTQFEYQPQARTTIQTDANGRVTTTVRDAAGRVVNQTLAEQGQTDFAAIDTQSNYDEAGRLAEWVDPLGNASSVIRDAAGRVTTTISPETAVGQTTEVYQTHRTYDDAGNLLSITDPSGSMTTHTYDSLGHRLSTTWPDPDGDGPLPAPSETLTHNGFGEVVAKTDHLGRVTTLSYDSLGRLSTLTPPDPDRLSDGTDGPLTAITQSWTYDAAGNVTAVVDSRGNLTTHHYDAAGRLIETVLPDPDPNDSSGAPSMRWVYDSEGRVLETIDVLGHSTTYQRDEAGREISRTLPPPSPGEPSPVVSRGYNAAGELSWISDPTGAVTTIEYDVAGQLTRLIMPDPDGPEGPLPAPQRSYTYDAAGRLNRFTDEAGMVTVSGYDEVGRVVSQTLLDPDGDGPLVDQVSRWIYDSSGRVVTSIDHGGRQTSYVYDRLGREITRMLPAPDESPNSRRPIYNQSYDAAGNLASTTDPLGNVIAYQYDARGRLTTKIDPATDAGSLITRFTHDQPGDLVAVTRVTPSLVDVDPVTTHEYDRSGRRIGTTLPAVTTGGGTLVLASSQTYDDAGQLITQTDTAGRVTEHHYDAAGRRIQTTITAAVPAGSTAAPEVTVTSQTYDAAGRMVTSTDALGFVTEYRYDNLGRTVAVIAPPSIGRTTHTVHDAAGRVVRTTTTATDPVSVAFAADFDSDNPLIDHAGRVGTPDGGVPGSVVSPAGQAVQFNSAARRLAFPANERLDALGRDDGDFAVAYWLRPDATGYSNWKSLFNKGNHYGERLAATFFVPGTTKLSIQFSTAVTLDEGVHTSALPPHQWTHVAVVKEGRQVRVYFNGQLDTQGTLAGATLGNDGPVTIGEDGTEVSIDDVRLLGRALSPDEIRDMIDRPNHAVTMTPPAGGVDRADEVFRTTSFRYDGWGREVLRTHPDPDGAGPLPAPRTQTAHDEVGNVDRVIEWFGNPSDATTASRTTQYLHDDLDRVITTIAPDPDLTDAIPAPRTHTGYDAAGNVLTNTDAAGRQTSHQYDALGRRTNTTLPDRDGNGPRGPVTLTTTYDVLGNNIARTDADGITTTWTYDELGRVLTRSLPDPDGNGPATAPLTEFTYDAAGNRVSERVHNDQPFGSMTQWQYDGFGRMIGMTNPTGDQTAYAYNAAGDRTSLTDGVGNVTHWTHDAEGRVLTETDAAGHVIAFTYDILGNQAAVIDRRGTTVKSFHDALDRSTGSVTIGTDGVELAHENTRYDAVGRVDRIDVWDSTSGGLFETFAYDDADRLTRRTKATSGTLHRAAIASSDHRYTYAVDNSLARVEVLAGGQWTTQNYLHNAAGDVVGIDQSGASAADLSVRYDRDAAGRIDSLIRYRTDQPGTGVQSVYQYDGLGRTTAIDHTDRLSGVTLAAHTQSFDAASRVIGTGSLADGATGLTLDAAGRLIGGGPHRDRR